MPVRDGRYVSFERLAIEEAAAKAAAPEVAAEDAAEEPAPEKAKRRRRSSGAAQAAIKEATGVDVDLESEENS